MSLRLFALSAFLASSQLVSAATEVAASTPILGTDTVHGCYSSFGELKLNGTTDFNSQGKCAGFCRDKGEYVAASNSNDCYCGTKYPPLNTLVDDSKCTEPCPGYSDQACGGLNTFTVYNTGVKVSVGDSANDTSSSTASGTATSSGDASSTATDKSSATASSGSSSKSSGGSNTVGIAVGVVVGLLVIAGIIGGVFFYMRRKRNQEIEDEHRRNAAVNAFVNGGKPPSSSGGLSISDQRLDPVMAQRRMSSGSIADNQDYSRRILRVTNA